MPAGSATAEGPWAEPDTLADWAEDDSGAPVLHLNLGHMRWRYWARRVTPAGPGGHECASVWGGLEDGKHG